MLQNAVISLGLCRDSEEARVGPCAAPCGPGGGGTNPYTPPRSCGQRGALCGRCVTQTVATAKSALSQGTSGAEEVLPENRQGFFCAWMEKSASRRPPSLRPWARPLPRNRPFDFSTRIKEVVAERPPPRHFCPQCGQLQGVAGLPPSAVAGGRFHSLPPF